MSGTYSVVVGNKGRIVVPAELRERAGLAEGSTLTLVDTGSGVLMLTRDELKELVRKDLTGADLVGELLRDRRREADADRVA